MKGQRSYSCCDGNRTQRFTCVARPTRTHALLALKAPFFRSTAGTPISIICEPLALGVPFPTLPHRFWDFFYCMRYTFKWKLLQMEGC